MFVHCRRFILTTNINWIYVKRKSWAVKEKTTKNFEPQSFSLSCVLQIEVVHKPLFACIPYTLPSPKSILQMSNVYRNFGKLWLWTQYTNKTCFWNIHVYSIMIDHKLCWYIWQDLALKKCRPSVSLYVTGIISVI